MPLPEAGVQFVSKGFADFMRNISSAVLAISNMGRMTENRLDAILSLNDAMVKVSQSAAGMGSAASEASTGIEQLGSALGDVFKSMSSWGKTGANIGGIIGTIISPGIGTTIGSISGYILGAISGLGAGIVKGILGIAASIGSAIVNVGKKIIGWVEGIVKSVLSTIGDVLSTIFNMLTGGIFQAGWNNLGNTILGSMFKFEVLKQAIRGVVNEIQSLSKEAFDAATGLQTLTARLNFLIASQYQAKTGIVDFNAAIAAVIPTTQSLLHWMAKLALASPVGIDEISKTLSMSIAMGWTAEEAKKLTKAIVDYTSAIGLSSDTAEKIIYNFAQMREQAKVTGTELRDLGRGAFVPIIRILDLMYTTLQKGSDAEKAFTGTFQEFRDAAAAGTVDVNAFFTAFEDYVATYLPDAAYKMNYTFAAVINNLHDLFQIMLGWEVLGPMIEEITKPVQDLIASFGTDEALLAAQRIGLALKEVVKDIKSGLGYIFDALGKSISAMGMALPSVEQVVKTLIEFGLALVEVGKAIAGFITKFITPIAEKIGAKFGPTFEKMRKNFFEWGADLIVGFASGMVQAAARVLTQAINFIAGILTHWFHASVPNIAPDIEKWGMDTIDAWLQGFTEADFTILDDIKSVVKDALGAFVNLGQMTDVQASQEYVDISVKLMQAMDELNKTGTISVGIFDDLRNIGGVYGEEIAKLLDLELQYAQAQEQVAVYEKAVADATAVATKAQLDYDNAVKKTSTTEVKTNSLIKEYNAMLRKGADKNILKSKLKIVNASEMELDANRKAEDAKQSQLDIANAQQQAAEDLLKTYQDSIKPLEDSVKLQQTLIKELTDLAQAQKDVTTAASGTASTVEDTADALSSLGADFTLEDPFKDIDLEGWIKDATSSFNTWFNKTLPGLWGNAGNLAFGPGSDFSISWNNLTTNVLPQSFGKAIGLLATAWDTFAKAIKLPSWDEIMSAWNGPSANEPGHNFGGGAEFGGIDTLQGGLLGAFTRVLDKFAEDIKTNGGIIATLTTAAFNLLSALGDQLKLLATNKDVQKSITEAIDNIAEFINSIFIGTDTGVNTPLGKLISGLTTFFINTFVNIATNSDVIGAAKNIGIAIGAGILEGIKAGLAGAIPSIPDIINDPNNVFNNPAGVMASIYGTGVTKASPKGLVDTFAGFGHDAAESLHTSMYNAITNEYDWTAMWNWITSDITDTWQLGHSSVLFHDYGVETSGSLAKGMDEQIKATIWDTIWQTITDKFIAFFQIGTPSKLFNGYGVDVIDGLVEGISTTIDSVVAVGGTIGIEIQKIISAVSSFLFGNSDEKSRSKSPQNPFYSMGQSIVQGLIDGFDSMIETLKSTWNALIELIPGDFADKFIIHSASKLMKGYGINVVKGLALGIIDSSSMLEKAMMGAIGSTIMQPAFTMQAPMSASPVYGGDRNVNLGGVSIYNGMDLATFNAMVQRAIIG
jgi:hypothetical protein